MTEANLKQRWGRVSLPLLGLLHGALAIGFALNAFLVDDDTILHVQFGWFLAGVLALWVALDAARLVPGSFRPLSNLRQGLVLQLQNIATGRTFPLRGRSPLARLMSWNMFLSFTGIFLTGWLMTTSSFWGSGLLEELHEFFVFWTGWSAALHGAFTLWARARWGARLRRRKE